jgi:dipeptidyl aminopeptidase/acylaminoacyl peptidase
MAGDTPADISRYLLASGASAPQLSPDGKDVVFRSSVTGTPQLWTLPVTGGAPRQLTFGNGVTFARWLPDSSGILYGADNNGDEQESYLLINRDGSSEREIFSATQGGFRALGDIGSDNDSLFLASTERTGLHYDIYQGSISSGDLELLFEGNYGNFARALSPDGRYLVVTETVGEDADYLYLLDTTTREMRVVSQPESRANHGDGGFAWSPDSQTLYMSSNTDREFAAVVAYDVIDGRFESLVESEFDLADVQLCGENGAYLVWTENRNGFDVLGGRHLASGSPIAFPAIPEGVYSLSCSQQSSTLIVGVNGWQTPGDIHAIDLLGGAGKRLVDSNLAGIQLESLVRPESITMVARDGVELQGLLYLPLGGDQTSPPPVIFEVHGGPTAQSRASFDPVSQYHVARGIAVFKPNVRGSTGFGRTYVKLDDQKQRLDSVRDLVDMLDFFKTDGRVDAFRAAVSGGSYGGYMVNAVLANYPNAFAAGVSRYGVADWVTALQVASPALKASDRIEYGDIRDPKWRAFYTVNSPIRQADKIRVPVLYSHGVMDPRIDIYETEVMVRTLRANGIEAPYIKVPDEGHGWRKLGNRLFYYRRQAEFLEAHLGIRG